MCSNCGGLACEKCNRVALNYKRSFLSLDSMTATGQNNTHYGLMRLQIRLPAKSKKGCPFYTVLSGRFILSNKQKEKYEYENKEVIGP